jgi:hypothetical protein
MNTEIQKAKLETVEELEFASRILKDLFDDLTIDRQAIVFNYLKYCKMKADRLRAQYSPSTVLIELSQEVANV